LAIANFYQILGIADSADEGTIEKAAKAKLREIQAQLYHPDQNLRKRAEETRDLIFEARRILLCPELRAKYNQTLIPSKPQMIIRGAVVQKNETPSDLTKKKSVSSQTMVSLEYSVVLLLDTSGSMAGKKLEDAQVALVDFLEHLGTKSNEFGFVAFGEQLKLSNGLTRDMKSLKQGIYNLTASGGTPFMSGLKKAHEEVAKKGRARSVLVIATDGIPTDSPEEQILSYAKFIKDSGARIICVGIGRDVNEKFLRALASSPQDYYSAKVSIELTSVYREIAAGLAVKK
jgi:Mg-chelatase subunit ChlD